MSGSQNEREFSSLLSGPRIQELYLQFKKKSKFYEKPTLDKLRISLLKMKGHASLNNVTKNTMLNTGRGLGKLHWIDVFTLIRDTFTYSGNQIQLITRREKDSRKNPSSNDKYYSEHEVDVFTYEETRGKDELETDFARDSKSS